MRYITDDKYVDSRGKVYRYRKYTKTKAWNRISGLADLKFEYIRLFVDLFFFSLFALLGIFGEGVEEGLDFYIVSAVSGVIVGTAVTAANSRPKKSVAYLLPISAKEYFTRNMFFYVAEVFLIMVGISIFGVWQYGTGVLDMLAKSENFTANLYLFSCLILYLIGLIPLLFMEKRKRVQRYMTMLLGVFCLIQIVTILVFCTGETKGDLIVCLMPYGGIILIMALRCWKERAGTIVEFAFCIAFFFLDEWIWNLSERIGGRGVYDMVRTGSGIRNCWVYLVAVFALVSVWFSLGMAYREVLPHRKMRNGVHRMFKF